MSDIKENFKEETNKIYNFKGETKKEIPGIEYKDFKKIANVDPERKADAEGHDLKDDLKADMNQGIK